MKKIISMIKRKYPEIDVSVIEKALVSAYLEKHNLDYYKNTVLCSFIRESDDICIELKNYMLDYVDLIDIDCLVSAFELLINEKEKKNKGIVYTPKQIRDYICKNVIHLNCVPKVIDPACGCGAFLVSAARRIHGHYKVSYQVIFDKFIWGCDIDAHSIEKSKILFSILALEEEGIALNKCGNIFCGNSLELLDNQLFYSKFDVVVGNPPYVRSKNIDSDIKKTADKWSIAIGNVDLYITFFQLGINLIKTDGKLGYITPNTYLQSLNGRGLRDYLRGLGSSITIIDFKGDQKFQGVTHYTCITIIDNAKKNNNIFYAIASGDLEQCKFDKYDISKYQKGELWRLFNNNTIEDIVKKIETQPFKLNDFNIKNGLATLCNELFFFKVEREDDKYFYRKYDGNVYKIEKEICIDIVKPNIIKNENDLIKKSEKGIYPYDHSGIIDKLIMQKKYPCAYEFLLKYKEKLDKRDKGKTEKYPCWYAYGRTQGMNNFGKKILIPYMADKGIAVVSKNNNLLFYCGYALFSECDDTLEILKILIESDVFLFYIKNTSKPYSKGFVSLAKNYIKNFGIPILSDNDKKNLLSNSGVARERYIAQLYGLNYQQLKLYCPN